MDLDLTSLPKNKFLDIISDESAKEYYGSVYDNMAMDNKFVWNWAAALFSFSWVFYRRLHKEAIIGSILSWIPLMVISLPLATFEKNSLSHSLYTLFICISVMIFTGFYGNYFYVACLARRTRMEIQLPKGTNLLAGIMFPIFMLSADTILIMFFSKIF